MSSSNANLTVGAAEARDELFTAPLTDAVPDRHPSILRPGGHESPLKYPAALRPGAGRQSRTPSANSASSAAAQQPINYPQPVKSVAYRAYSPQRPQSPSDELSAEIEGYFAALEVTPLNISKPNPQDSADVAAPPRPPKEGPQRAESPEQRAFSPPVPPKERFDAPEHIISPVSAVESPQQTPEQDHQVVSPLAGPASHTERPEEDTEAPPAYDESEYLAPPPEKVSTSPPSRTDSESLAGSAAASAAQIGGAVAGVDMDDIYGASDREEPGKENVNQANTVAPPPLPPRQSKSPAADSKGPAPAAAFAPPPPPPKRPASPSYKTGGAAATSAAHVGASVAGVGSSAGLAQARKALGKRINHMMDKAKEHHAAREHHCHAKKTSVSKTAKTSDDPKGKKKISSASHGGQVYEAESLEAIM